MGGFYGDKDKNGRVHEPISADICRKWMDHCEREIEKDAASLGMGYSVRDIRTQESDISVLKEDEYCPFKTDWLEEMIHKFEILGI